MTTVIQPATEKESRLVRLARLRELIKKGRFTEARNYADSLRRIGISEPAINHSCYHEFSRLNRINRKKAERLARIFEDYKWEYWLR